MAMIPETEISVRVFDSFEDKSDIVKITLENEYLKVSFLNYGAIVQSLWVKKKPYPVNVVYGMDSLKDYMRTGGCFGAVIGPISNRIANGTFSIDGETFTLEKNNGCNNLHSGSANFAQRIWNYSIVTGPSPKVIFSILHSDKTAGIPGNIQVQAIYSLEANSLQLSLQAVSDKKTVINLTNHSYFNLDGFFDGTTVENHMCQIASDDISDITEDLIPIGKKSIRGSCYDFSKAKELGQLLGSRDRFITLLNGLDHNYHLNCGSDQDAVILAGKSSGITMRIRTDQPCVQFYSTNSLKADACVEKENGEKITVHGAIAIEPQAMPNSVNCFFGDKTVYEPKEIYSRKIGYYFEVNS